MVELRKRKTPPPAPVRPAKKKAAPKAEKPKESKVSKAKAAVAEKIEAVKEAVTGKPNGEKAEAPAAPAAPGSAPKVGDSIDLPGFGGEVETHEGTKTSLSKLVEQSKSGVVLFTYPKASTPGCEYSPCLRLVYQSLTLPLYRYQTSMLFPRLVHAPNGHWLRHLRPLER
jgi:thioredoxin-dependent peroxiredoxin